MPGYSTSGASESFFRGKWRKAQFNREPHESGNLPIFPADVRFGPEEVAKSLCRKGESSEFAGQRHVYRPHLCP